MNKEIINEWLSDIATPTGISYSGDQTISKSMAEKIVDYVSNLEQALDKIEKYVVNLKENHIFWENDDFTNGRNAAYEMISNDVLEIIQKAKGDVKNENNNV